MSTSPSERLCGAVCYTVELYERTSAGGGRTNIALRLPAVRPGTATSHQKVGESVCLDVLLGGLSCVFSLVLSSRLPSPSPPPSLPPSLPQSPPLTVNHPLEQLFVSLCTDQTREERESIAMAIKNTVYNKPG